MEVFILYRDTNATRCCSHYRYTNRYSLCICSCELSLRLSKYIAKISIFLWKQSTLCHGPRFYTDAQNYTGPNRRSFHAQLFRKKKFAGKRVVHKNSIISNGKILRTNLDFRLLRSRIRKPSGTFTEQRQTLSWIFRYAQGKKKSEGSFTPSERGSESGNFLWCLSFFIFHLFTFAFVFARCECMSHPFLSKNAFTLAFAICEQTLRRD